VTTSAALAALENEWRELQTRCQHPSIFTTFDYIRIAWETFHGPKDRLLILVVREAGKMVAIAPFRITLARYMNIPARVVDWLATWEGDRPGMLCGGDSARCWQRIERYFAREFHQWDLLRLSEISAPVAPDGELARVSHVETAQDSIGFHIPIEGSFEDYLARIDSKVKSNWRNRSRKVFALGPAPQMHRIDVPADMAAAVDRFIRLERSSWKAEAGLGVGKDERHRDFYAHLTTTLAARGEAAFYFLRSGEADLAASLLFMLDDVMYERHIAYSPEHANLSPGIVLRAELMKDLFGSTWREFDLMGMQPSVGRQRHKEDWALGRRETVSQQFFRRTGRMLPVYLARRVREWLKRIRPAHAASA
jgi:CelD/BcsL family acetyltransferase involved in cellulose biosynthesis